MPGRLAEHRPLLPVGALGRVPPRIARGLRRGRLVGAARDQVLPGLRGVVALGVGVEVPALVGILVEQAGYPVDRLALVEQPELLRELGVGLDVLQVTDRVVVIASHAGRLEAVTAGRQRRRAVGIVAVAPAEVGRVTDRGVLLVGPVAREVGRRRNEIGEADVALEGQRVLRPVLVVELVLRVEAHQRQFAGVDRVVLGPAVGPRALVRDAGRHRPAVVDQPARGDAAAGVVDVVEVFLLGAVVAEDLVLRRGAVDDVDEAAVTRGEADQAQRPGIAQRNVDHAADVVARVALAHVAGAEVDVGLEGGGIGLVGDDAHHAGLRAGAVQGALRTAQRLDPLDVDHARVGLAVQHQRLLVEVDRGRGLENEGALRVGDAAEHHGRGAGVRLHDVDAGQEAHVVVHAAQAGLHDRAFRQRLDALGNVLQRLGALARGDGDLLELQVLAGLGHVLRQHAAGR